MTNTYARILLSLFLFCFAAVGLRAQDVAVAEEAPAPLDEIHMTNGSHILGTVSSVRDGTLTLETDFAGTLAIPVEMVASLRTANPVVMQMADESVIEAQALAFNESQIVVTDAAGRATSRAVEDLLVVNPEPWELGHGYKWTGLVSFAFDIERGNTDTDELDYKVDTTWRSDDDRYILKLDGEIDEANDVKSADNWTIQGKYDYFLSDRTYWGAHTLAEQDEFADLDLRFLIGPYFGREFFTEPVFMFSGELGAAYVNEDFITAEDQEYPAANWGLHMSSDYLGGDSRLYFDQLGVWNMDETSDVIVNSTFGLAFPLLFGFEAAAEIIFEYDSGAVEGVEELDETYALRLGYTW